VEQWLAIVAFRCEVAGKLTDSLDFQVRCLYADSLEDVEERIQSKPTVSYENDFGEMVTWPLVGVVAAEPFTEDADGKEVVGFVTGCHEFAKWAKVVD